MLSHQTKLKISFSFFRQKNVAENSCIFPIFEAPKVCYESNMVFKNLFVMFFKFGVVKK
jgi:hypothetical protein